MGVTHLPPLSHPSSVRVVKLRLVPSIVFVAFSPADSPPHVVRAGQFSLTYKPSIPLHFLLASHVLCCKSFRCPIEFTHSHPLPFQVDKSSISRQILCLLDFSPLPLVTYLLVRLLRVWRQPLGSETNVVPPPNGVAFPSS